MWASGAMGRTPTMPEGHLLHRLARDHGELVGERLRATSPQGRFAAGAAARDGRRLPAGLSRRPRRLRPDVGRALVPLVHQAAEDGRIVTAARPAAAAYACRRGRPR